MAHFGKDTHDQNEGLDTPDTRPSIMRVIAYAILAYLLVACVTYGFLYGFDVSEQTEQAQQQAILQEQQVLNAFSPAAYFTDAFNPELTPEQVNQGNLRVVESPAELGSLLGTNTEIEMILVDEAVLRDEANLPILRQQVGLGKMVIGLRVPQSTLSEQLERSATAADLERDEVLNAAVWVSGWYTDGEGNSAELSSAYPQFLGMMADLHQRLR